VHAADTWNCRDGSRVRLSGNSSPDRGGSAGDLDPGSIGPDVDDGLSGAPEILALAWCSAARRWRVAAAITGCQASA
jgi:hypothetical protein